MLTSPVAVALPFDHQLDPRSDRYTFTDYLVRMIESHPNETSTLHQLESDPVAPHDASKAGAPPPPLFVYAAFQGVHGPLEVGAA